MNLLAFGQVAGITGNEFVIDESIMDTDDLQIFLIKKYPALSEIKYALAVEKKMVHENTRLNENVTVALLPPFSGG